MKVTAAATIAAGIAALLAGVLALRGPDPSAVPAPDDVFGRIMSPYCEGLTLAECPSSSSASLRQQIRDKIANGASNAEIDAWVVANFGESALGRPRGPAAWIAPAAIAAIGAAAVMTMVSRRTRRRALANSWPEPTADQKTRLEAELEEFERRGGE